MIDVGGRTNDKKTGSAQVYDADSLRFYQVSTCRFVFLNNVISAFCFFSGIDQVIVLATSSTIATTLTAGRSSLRRPVHRKRSCACPAADRYRQTTTKLVVAAGHVTCRRSWLVGHAYRRPAPTWVTACRRRK